MDKLQFIENKEILKSILKIDRYSFKQKMMTAVMFFSGLTANGSNLFMPQDFKHAPGLEKITTVAENLIYGNQIKKDMEEGRLGQKQHCADNYAHKYADILNGEEGLRATIIAYIAGLVREGSDLLSKTAKNTKAVQQAYENYEKNNEQFEIDSADKGAAIAVILYLCRLDKNIQTLRMTMLKQLINNEPIFDKDVEAEIIKDGIKDMGNNTWGLAKGLKIAYTHRFENMVKFLLGQPTSDLDIKQEALESLRYLNLDANEIGTENNHLAELINARDLQKAQEQKKIDINQGIPRVRHNLDAGTIALVEEMRRRLMAYVKNATVASNSEKYKSEDGRFPPLFEDLPKTEKNYLDEDYLAGFLKKLEEHDKKASVQLAKSILPQDNVEAFTAFKKKIKHQNPLEENSSKRKTDKQTSTTEQVNLPNGWKLIAKDSSRT